MSSSSSIVPSSVNGPNCGGPINFSAAASLFSQMQNGGGQSTTPLAASPQLNVAVRAGNNQIPEGINAFQLLGENLLNCSSNNNSNKLVDGINCAATIASQINNLMMRQQQGIKVEETLRGKLMAAASLRPADAKKLRLDIGTGVNNSKGTTMSREKRKFNTEISDLLVHLVLQQKHLLVENNTSRDLNFSDQKRNAWIDVRSKLVDAFPGFEQGIENIKSHWRYRKRKVTDAYNELRGRPNIDAILGQKLLTLDYEIYKELAASDMLERTGRQSENLRDDNEDASPGSDVDELSTLMTTGQFQNAILEGSIGSKRQCASASSNSIGGFSSSSAGTGTSNSPPSLGTIFAQQFQQQCMANGTNDQNGTPNNGQQNIGTVHNDGFFTNLATSALSNGTSSTAMPPTAAAMPFNETTKLFLANLLQQQQQKLAMMPEGGEMAQQKNHGTKGDANGTQMHQHQQTMPGWILGTGNSSNYGIMQTPTEKEEEEEEKEEDMLEAQQNAKAMHGPNANNIDVEGLERLAKFKMVKDALKQQQQNGNGNDTNCKALLEDWIKAEIGRANAQREAAMAQTRAANDQSAAALQFRQAIDDILPNVLKFLEEFAKKIEEKA